MFKDEAMKSSLSSRGDVPSSTIFHPNSNSNPFPPTLAT